jgi:hypothetical protein
LLKKEFLRSIGVEHVRYGDGLAERLRSQAPAGAQKHGTKSDGSAEAASRETLAHVANLIAWGEILMPLTAI